MASQVPVTGKPPRPPHNPYLTPRDGGGGGGGGGGTAGEGGGGGGGGGYVGRFKRLQRMKERKNVSSHIHRMVSKNLPKIHGGDADRNRAVLHEVQRTTGATLLPLPGVQVPEYSNVQVSPRRKSLPMKTFHFRVNPEHSSFISKSLPSLPSIPGSPSYPEDQEGSPLTERIPAQSEPRAKIPIFPSKHRFERIVVRKHLHEDATSEPGGAKSHTTAQGPTDHHVNSTSTGKTTKIRVVGWANNDHSAEQSGANQHTLVVRGGGGGRGEKAGGGGGGEAVGEAPRAAAARRQSERSVRFRYMQGDGAIQEEDGGRGRDRRAKSEPNPTTSDRHEAVTSDPRGPKWKEDCGCLRCQMLKRQIKDGDTDYYSLWGRYPCATVIPDVNLDD